MPTINNDLKNEFPLACNLTAIPAEKRDQHQAAAEQIFRAVRETRELPSGYAFRLPEEPEMLFKAAEFVTLERLCCPFFGFTLEFEPEGGPLWLKLTGGDGVKQYLQAELLPWKSSLR
jgi:hypothetical protein